MNFIKELISTIATLLFVFVLVGVYFGGVAIMHLVLRALVGGG